VKVFIVLIAASLLTAYISGFAVVKYRVNDLFVNWSQEERFVMALDALNMIKDSSVKEWISGHGIGSYRFYNQKYTTYNNITFNFPHNVFLQVLFENGIIGFIAIFGGLSCLVFNLWNISHQLQNQPAVFYLSVTVFAAFWVTFMYYCFANSIYAKYSIYPLSLIIGTFLALYRTGLGRIGSQR